MTIVASNTPGQQPAARPRAAAAPGPLVLAASPLIALSRDPQLLAAVKMVTVPGRAVRTAGSEVDLSAALVAGQAGVVLIDGAAIVSPIATLTQGLHAQFPELVLIVAGGHDEQGKLVAQISDGTVYRFLHKPVSEQRVRLFVEAAWRRYEQDDPLRNAATASLPVWPPRRTRRALIAWFALAAAVTATLPVVWVNMNEPAATAPHTSAVREAASAPLRDAVLPFRRARGPEPAQTAPSAARTRPPTDHGVADVAAPTPATSALPAAAAAPLAATVGTTAATAAVRPATTAQTAAATAPAVTAPTTPTAQPADARLAEGLGADSGQPATAANDRARPDQAAAPPAATPAAAPAAATTTAAAATTAAVAADADSTHLAALHDQAAPQRDATQVGSLARLAQSFDERLQQGRLLEPASDSAKFYLAALVEADAASPATQRARTAYGARALEEGRHTLAAGDYRATHRWVDEARNAGAADIDQLEAALGAAEDGAGQAGNVVSETTLARTSYVPPEFPILARQRGIEGWVDLEFLVGSDGAVSDVAVIGAQPVGVFEQAALTAVRQWRYRPVLRDGHGISQRARVRLRFAMQQP